MAAVGMRTPWGKADHIQEVVPGISIVSTPGHGGYKLDRRCNSSVHEAWRQPGGWYEEDAKWAIVAVTFQQLAGFGCSVVEAAHRTLKDYYPDQYTAVYGVPVELSESYVLRQRAAQGAA